MGGGGNDEFEPPAWTHDDEMFYGYLNLQLRLDDDPEFARTVEGSLLRNR